MTARTMDTAGCDGTGDAREQCVAILVRVVRRLVSEGEFLLAWEVVREIARIYAVCQEWLRLEDGAARERIRQYMLWYYAYEARMAGYYFAPSMERRNQLEQLKKSCLVRLQDEEYAVKRWSYYLLMPFFAEAGVTREERDILVRQAQRAHEQVAMAWGWAACDHAREALQRFTGAAG